MGAYWGVDGGQAWCAFLMLHSAAYVYLALLFASHLVYHSICRNRVVVTLQRSDDVVLGLQINTE